MDIKDVTAIVTGGVSGLGGATVRALSEGGAHVVAIDLQKAVDGAEPLKNVTYVAADVTDADQVQAAVETASATGHPLRVVVNCAGIGTAGRVLSKKGPHDLGAFSSVVGVNLIGSFNVMRLAAAAIAQTEPLTDGARGVVINTASIAAFEGQIGQIAYAASKGGVVGMTVPAARDLAQYGIRVNTVAPGIVDTPMLAGVEESFREQLGKGVPFPQRLGLPTEFARLITMIVEHDYLNGETIRMDGALRMQPR